VISMMLRLPDRRLVRNRQSRRSLPWPDAPFSYGSLLVLQENGSYNECGMTSNLQEAFSVK